MSESEKKIYSLTELVQQINKAWHETGQTGNLIIKGDNITVTESEVVMKYPVMVTFLIKKDSVDLSTLEAVKPAVNQSSSQ